MSLPSDKARRTEPGLGMTDGPNAQTRPRSRRSELGGPHHGAEDPTLSDITDDEISGMRPPFWPYARTRSSARPAWGYRVARTTQEHQTRDVVFLLGSLGIVIAFVLVVAALMLGPVVSVFSGPSPGQPVASGPLIITPPPTTTSSSVPASSATFVALDTKTQGNWHGVYGDSGYLIAGDTQHLPTTIQMTPSGAAVWEWASSTADARALVKPELPTTRVAACWYSPTSFTIDVNITDGHRYRLALYVLDFDRSYHRAETVSVVDPGSGRVLDTRHVSAFGNGEYLVWQVSGHVTIQVTNASGSRNAAASALFVTPATRA